MSGNGLTTITLLNVRNVTINRDYCGHTECHNNIRPTLASHLFSITGSNGVIPFSARLVSSARSSEGVLCSMLFVDVCSLLKGTRYRQRVFVDI